MSEDKHASLSLANPYPEVRNDIQKVGLTFLGMSALLLFLAWSNATGMEEQFLWPFFGTLVAGGSLFIIGEYRGTSAGIKNHGIMRRGINMKGASAWVLGVVLTGFYTILYFKHEWMQGLIDMFNPLSLLLRKAPSDQWFVYGSFYTISVLIMGAKFLWKYRHNNYHRWRTISVMFFQLGFAFLIPAFLKVMYNAEYYFSYFWPLDSYKLQPDTINWHTGDSAFGSIGWVFIGISAALTFIVTPIMTYFYGKRWYCSWVCGCGGLAETAGDPFRHLSDKSLKAWKVERWMIHAVLGLVVGLTVLLWLNLATGGGVLGGISGTYQKIYGFAIGNMFAGVIGTGFYPILGNRIWCRFGCPMAAVLGIIQKYKSRFRITTNGGQCISCGNCSTYCEQGIDVRWYAQRGQNIVRASCVGCGVCSAVCPRGVLRLENGPEEGRITDDPIIIGNDNVSLKL